MYFQNPSNGYIEKVSLPFVWTLLFGPFYFAARDVWVHAVIAFVLIFLTIGLSWLVYPFAARSILQTSYLRKGWVPLTRSEVKAQTGRT